MANTEGTKKKNTKLNAVKSLAWLVETVARAGAGYLILTNFDHIVTLVLAMYFLGTATALLVSHFFKAYSK